MVPLDTPSDHSMSTKRPSRDRSIALEAGVQALVITDGRWRNWGALTIVRTIVKGMEAAGYKIVRSS
jgi:hypothetical protein